MASRKLAARADLEQAARAFVAAELIAKGRPEAIDGSEIVEVASTALRHAAHVYHTTKDDRDGT